MASNNPGSSNAIAGALTYPVNNENAQYQPVDVQPRQPRNLQGLLRFAMEATKAEDAPGTSQLGPMDEERTRFLTQALIANMVNVHDILRNNIRLLSDTDRLNLIRAHDPLPEDILIAFEEIREYIDSIDIANDFDKLGGFIVFPMCYSCESIELHRWANLTLAQVCQNNPRCQERALRCCFLPVLMHKLRENRHEDFSLRALSSVIRNYEPAMIVFVGEGGCEILAERLREGMESELPCAAFFITYLCRNSKDARDRFIRNDLIQTIIGILKEGRSDASEYLLNTLVTLVEMQPDDVLHIYRDPAFNLKRILLDHLRIRDVKNGRFIEEKEYCEVIIRLAFEECDLNEKPEEDLQEVEQADR